MSDQRAAAGITEKPQEERQYIAGGPSPREQLIRQTVNRECTGGDGLLGVDQRLEQGGDLAVIAKTHGGDLDDPVAGGPEPGRFEVERE